jgi:hypothetical protein
VENLRAICFEIDDLSHFWIGNDVICGAVPQPARQSVG